MTTAEQRKTDAARRASRHRKEADYYRRQMQAELATARQIESTWGLDSPDDQQYDGAIQSEEVTT